jgi:hypothetical protein
MAAHQHQFTIAHRPATQKTQVILKQRKRETWLRLLKRRHRSSLANGLPSDWCGGCRVALPDVALSGRDGVFVLLGPCWGLGPLGILPCFEQSVYLQVESNILFINLQGPWSLSWQPPAHSQSPPNCLGRFSLGICASNSFW